MHKFAQTKRPFMEGASIYKDARFSPDARHIAYATNESGHLEVFVQARDGGARWQVSTNGGYQPHWCDDGREIVYLDPDRRMMAVEVTSGPNGLSLGGPFELFTVEDLIVECDATGDHERFLIATLTDLESKPLRVILNWDAGL